MVKKAKSPSSGKSNGSEDFPFKRELIVIAKTEMAIRSVPDMDERVTSFKGTDVSSLSEFLKKEDVFLEPLFGMSEDRIKERTASMVFETAEALPEFENFYHVDASDDRLDALAESLSALDAVESAYVKPAGEPPMAAVAEMINDMQPAAEEPPVATPDFTNRQIYLNPAPAGIDAHYAWTISGGRGAGVKIIDCEWGWQFSHEDLLQNAMGVVVGTSLSYTSDPTANNSTNRAVNHGTSVIGEIGGDRNTMGITGICPDASIGAASFVNKTSAQAIREAADKLRPGDIILLEIHRPGPRHNFQGRTDQLGYIAIEWWPDDFAAIRYAVNKGVIVVEAAGNGAENLDDALYSARPAGFPASWRNPFNPANPSSGAVLVGAGAPPPGTHGNDHGPDRSRLGFSNYGARLDCQGWGREVTSTGYGDLQGGSSIHANEWYTNRFSGTSSASPIIVGALGCLQGILRARGASLLTPTAAINLLRSTGSPQQDAPGRPQTQRIGNRPDLRQMIQRVAPARRWRGWEDLGGVIIGAPTVASWSSNRLDCFVRGTSNRMYHKWWDGHRWSGWENLGGVIVEAPGAVSWGANRIDCFAPGTNNHMYHKWWDGSAWRGWEDLGGVIIGAPAAASWAPNRLDCFVRGTNNSMYHKWWDGHRWSGWENLGGVLASAPAAVSWGPNRIDCFVAGTNNHMYHKWWDGSAWRGWEDLGGVIIGAPTVASWAPNRLDCFARGTNNHMYHKWYA